MRIITSVGIAGWLILTIVANSFGGPRQQGAEIADKVVIPQRVVSLDDENEIAGLTKGSKPEVVTWERVYALALVRARAGRGALMQTFDPVDLGRQAERLGAADFTRFRNDFFTGGTFRDPAPGVFALLGRLQTIENARWHLFFLENLQKLVQELAQHQSTGMSRVDVSIILAASIKGRQRLDHQKRQFRDGLDELKVTLGLSPQVAIILDRKAIAGFGDVFESVDNWQRQSGRHTEDLDRLSDRSPDPGDVIVDGQPVLGAIDVIPDRWEEVMTKMARLALEKRGDLAKGAANEGARAGLELHARRRVRHLVEMRRAHLDAKRGYAEAVLIGDQAFERLTAPRSDGGLQRSLQLERVVEQAASITTFKDQLAELWTAFRAERLALYREIGVMPYADWKSFYADLTARQTGSQ